MIKPPPLPNQPFVPRPTPRPSFDEIYMLQAFLMSTRSTCKRLRVGSIIASIDGRQVYAVGYNGNASGLANGCDSDVPGQCGCLHSEENAVINCTAPRSADKIAYVTHLPCVMCAKRLINLGSVARVVYARPYRITDSLALFQQAGISTSMLVPNPDILKLSV